MFRDKSFPGILFLLISCAAVAGPCLATAQNSSPIRSAVAIVKSSNLFAQANVQPELLEPGALGQAFAINSRALTAVPPRGITDAMDNGSLSTSGKEHPVLSLSKANLLAPAKVHPGAFREFSSPGLNVSKILNSEQPDLRLFK